jgi:hypothetical protein
LFVSFVPVSGLPNYQNGLIIIIVAAAIATDAVVARLNVNFFYLVFFFL